MLDLRSLLAPGESEAALHAVAQNWLHRCEPATPLEQERVEAAIAMEWRFLRMDRLYHAMRDPNNIETDARYLVGLQRQRHDLKKKVELYRQSTRYYQPGTEPKKTPPHVLAAMAEKRRKWRGLF